MSEEIHMKVRVNKGSSAFERCAFCQYWYDPTHRAIEPTGVPGVWKFDSTIRNKCMANPRIAIERPAGASCKQFVSKV